MTSTFFGLNIGLRGIMANQGALNTVGHNIANASTAGYSRQEAVIEAGEPWTIPGMNSSGAPGQCGTGAEITEIRQIRDSFLDSQYRSSVVGSGYWEAKKYALDKAESIINEPSTSGLSTVMNNFWQALEDLGNNPTVAVNRSVVAQRGQTLATTLNDLSTQFDDLRSEMDDLVGIEVDEINSIATQIRDLNIQIKTIEADPANNANDWRDKRNVLLDKLSKLVNTTVLEQTDGSVDVNIGGYGLVQGSKVNELVAVKKADPIDPTNPKARKYYEVQWQDGTKLALTDGYLKGVIQSRDEIAPQYLDELDTIAENLYAAMNTMQKAGYGLDKNAGSNTTNPDFFVVDPTKVNETRFAMKITMNSQLMNSEDNLNKIAASSTAANTASQISNKYDGKNALQMAAILKSSFIGGQLKLQDSSGNEVGWIQVKLDPTTNQPTYTGQLETTSPPTAITASGLTYENGVLKVNQTSPSSATYSYTISGGASFEEYFSKCTSSLGVDSDEANKMVTNQTLMVNTIDEKRQEVMGVSLDEEMANMIRCSQSYNASARLVTAIDEMIDVLVNRLGTVGR